MAGSLAESEVGKGATFYLMLGHWPGVRRIHEEWTSDMAAARVLIVDDNPSNVKLAGYLLTAEGFDVRSVEKPEDVPALVASWTPELVLMDLRLPGTDGLSLTRTLRANPENARIVIIAFSAEASRSEERRALEAGCDGYIAKPIDVGSFSSTVRQYIDSGRPAK